MKIDHLKVSNFRGIREVEMYDLGTMVIVAGQNGSGKSCIFDAIRLLKSVYGGYQQNEWQQWLGEFQIQITNRASDFASMFNDASKPLSIVCGFKLSAEERSYIQANASDLLTEATWRMLIPEAYGWGGMRMAPFAAQFRDREPEVRARVEAAQVNLMAELAKPILHAQCIIPVGDVPRIVPSIALEAIFSTFRPREIGVIDYHGAQRHYGRELVQGINLNLDANEQQRSQSALYNYSAKYMNVKAEMASSYIREVLSEQAGIPRSTQSSLTNTLKELFETFFPDKTFLGPQPTPDGKLTFPVQTAGGNVHDLDELSAGEKEILYGYLRIRNSAPQHSIILLDEPELHLNPRLIRGLPGFYQKNLGWALDNQIWLVTHSDALLREVVGRDGYNVFHMLPCGNVPAGETQLKPLSVNADLELAIIDLVGDLAAYRPSGKVVIFEGGGDSDFDQNITGKLFPELLEHANLVSGSNKARVQALQEVLEKATEKAQLPFKFFAITDRDSETHINQNQRVRSYSWDVYHVENYFLQPLFIGRVLEALGNSTIPREAEITDDLRECARESMSELVRHELAEFANSAMVGAIDTRTDPKAGDVGLSLSKAVERSLNRFESVAASALSREALSNKELELRRKYEEHLASGEWIRSFRGRDILKRYAGKRVPGLSYEVFRNLIISQMRDASYQPPGMKQLIDRIIAD